MTELVVYLNYLDGDVSSIKKTNNLPQVLESNVIQILESEIDSTRTISSIYSIPVYGKSSGLETNSVELINHIFVPTCIDTDLDNSGSIGFGDLSILAACYNIIPITPSCVTSDFDRDGTVGFKDQQIIADCFGQTV